MRCAAVMLAVVVMVGVARADDRAQLPAQQALSCPAGETSCEIVVVGVIARQQRNVKWDDIRIDGRGDGGLPKQIFASINIPHRQRLKLRMKTRYQIVVHAEAPFGHGDLWIIKATPTRGK